MTILTKAIRILKKEGLSAFLKALLAFLDHKTGIISFLLIPYTIYRLRNSESEELLNELFSNGPLGLLYKPTQIREEVEALINTLKKIEPKYVLEIGTAQGGTLLLWVQVATDDALIISIDLPGGPFGGGYPLLKGLTYRFFRRNKQRIVLIRANSHHENTLRRVKDILRGAKLDFLFIDGDHSYEGVKKDFEMYAPLVKRGGIIAFHDIVQGSKELVGGVPLFWGELKKRYKDAEKYEILEIIHDRNQGGYGIGVLLVK